MKQNVMTVRELARYLKMKPVTIYKHAQTGKLPAFKVGATWRFKRKTSISGSRTRRTANQDHLIRGNKLSIYYSAFLFYYKAFTPTVIARRP